MNPVSPDKTLTETVATVLRSEILSGQYRAGERLPSERDPLSAREKTA
jgi:DNA-binding FadR family transcriptional regulator